MWRGGRVGRQRKDHALPSKRSFSEYAHIGACADRAHIGACDKHAHYTSARHALCAFENTCQVILTGVLKSSLLVTAFTPNIFLAVQEPTSLL
jgi:hypothetical protein